MVKSNKNTESVNDWDYFLPELSKQKIFEVLQDTSFQPETSAESMREYS